MVERGREKLYEVYSSNAALTNVVESDSLDIVVAFDVLEHCDQLSLRSLLREAHSILKPSGCLIARVPSGDSPFGRAVQHGDLTHRLTLGSSAVRQLADEIGFLVRQIREPAFPLLGLGTASFLRRLGVWVARRLVFPVVRRMFMGGADIVLSPDMTFVLVKPTAATSQT